VFDKCNGVIESYVVFGKEVEDVGLGFYYDNFEDVDSFVTGDGTVEVRSV